MGAVFFYILFLKLPCSRLLYLLNEKEKSKPNKTNKQSNTKTRTLLSMNRTWFENFKKHFFSSKIDIHEDS